MFPKKLVESGVMREMSPPVMMRKVPTDAKINPTICTFKRRSLKKKIARIVEITGVPKHTTSAGMDAPTILIAMYWSGKNREIPVRLARRLYTKNRGEETLSFALATSNCQNPRFFATTVSRRKKSDANTKRQVAMARGEVICTAVCTTTNEDPQMIITPIRPIKYILFPNWTARGFMADSGTHKKRCCELKNMNKCLRSLKIKMKATIKEQMRKSRWK